ncbi:uncharacterized protein EV420DRAFT_1754003 [Desarmillaria tabescens]|uniref:Uncharacterized protein n=1 Tax=Armillaria tabescens TaxID=1929756 RepID=A0AA39J7A3_ARMTA|nr:uncharacterized protein EV420DRAFT_1754003 [Desarmillaria tabescens]KAK0435568.1 hypothetical protein EV420DRAFT_1754003 [Desarmillaria tabescens]
MVPSGTPDARIQITVLRHSMAPNHCLQVPNIDAKRQSFTMTDELIIDFTKPNHRLNTNRSNIPLGWSCDWARFEGSDLLAPCINGRIRENAILEGYYSIFGEIFFVMYKMWQRHGAILLVQPRHGQSLQVHRRYPTLEAFMERAALWINGDAQIYSVTPFAAVETKPGPIPPKELEDAWDLEEEAIRTYFNVELEGIYDIPRGTFKAIMFYHDLMVFLCSGRFYVWELAVCSTDTCGKEDKEAEWYRLMGMKDYESGDDDEGKIELGESRRSLTE